MDNDIKDITKELEKMGQIDKDLQKERSTWSENTDWNIILETEANQLKRLIEITDQYGYISKDKFGKDAATSAWSVMQHATKKDVEFMERYMNWMEKDQGDIPQIDLLRTKDRIEIYKGQKQIYGTGLFSSDKGKTWEFNPIVDIKNVDRRRKKFGIHTLKTSAKKLEKDMGGKVILPEGYVEIG